MIDNVQNVGYIVHGKTIGETWLGLVETVLKNGKFELDENRGRFAIPNVRFSSETTNPRDVLIDEFGDQKK